MTESFEPCKYCSMATDECFLATALTYSLAGSGSINSSSTDVIRNRMPSKARSSNFGDTKALIMRCTEPLWSNEQSKCTGYLRISAPKSVRELLEEVTDEMSKLFPPEINKLL